MPVQPAVPRVQPSVLGRVQPLLPKLKSATANLNSQSDKLNQSAESVAIALKNIGVGVASWVVFDTYTHPTADYSRDFELGFTKINNDWSLAIRSTVRQGNEPDEVDSWRFNEAPRSLRIKALPVLPELVAQIIKDTEDAAREISANVIAFAEVANAIQEHAGQSDVPF
jgi:hypothetical protein